MGKILKRGGEVLFRLVRTYILPGRAFQPTGRPAPAPTRRELARTRHTDRILIAAGVMARFLEHAASHPENEVGALLLGRLQGRYLLVEDLVAARSVGTRSNVSFTPADFQAAQRKAKRGQCTVGWAHSHPGHSVFLSPTDKKHQTEGQGLFPDYVALVMDPFYRNGVELQCFRVTDGRSGPVPWAFISGGSHAA